MFMFILDSEMTHNANQTTLLSTTLILTFFLLSLFLFFFYDTISHIHSESILCIDQRTGI